MPALRTFSLLNKSAAQSVFAYPCNLVDFDGNLDTGAAAGLYLQFHNKATAAANNDVPLKTFLIPSAGPTPLASIFQQLGPVTFSTGLSIGISSTENTYTAATANFSIFGEIEEGTQSTDTLSGLTVQATFSSDDLGVIIDGSQAGNSEKRLYAMTMTNAEAADRYFVLCVVPANTPADDAGTVVRVKPVWFLVPTGTTRTVNFGPNGYLPRGTRYSGGVATTIFGLAVTVSKTVGPTLTTSGDLGCTLVSYIK